MNRDEYYNKIFNMLIQEYGEEKVKVRCGESEDIQYTIYPSECRNYPPGDKTDLAIYLNRKFEIAVAWDIEHRRKNNTFVKTCSLSRKWDELIPDGDGFHIVCKKMGTRKESPLEKVLVMSIDYLEVNYRQVWEILKVASDSSRSFDEYNTQTLEVWEGDRCSEIIMRKKRDWKFRNSILKAYQNQCAICRCSADAVLQAAHIKSVKSGGSDNVNNGICLCANHHLMFDHRLISFDWDSRTLKDVDDSVKNMPWYCEFITKYQGRILKPKS
ncbi:MAG: HNH endonuclease [Oscillospiraceae bacterium]|nr:HNH endonuclease [Oscillospiraceae bacterium]